MSFLPTSPGRASHDVPKSIKEITDQAENFSFNINIPFKYWIQSCKTLRQEASFAMREGDYARAYLMLYRESCLVMNHLRTHPEFKDPESRRLYRPLFEDLGNLVDKLEQIKPIIKEEFDEYQRMTASAVRKGQSSAERQTLRPRPIRDGPRMVDITPETVDYAVDLAQDELRKRYTSQRVSRPAGYESTPQSRKEFWVDPDDVDEYHGYDDGYRRDAPPPPQPLYEPSDDYRDGYQDSNDDWRSGLEATRRTLDSMTSQRQSYESDLPPRTTSHSQPYYPSPSRSRPVNYTPEQPTSHLPPSSRPHRPPKEAFDDENPFLPRPASKPEPYRSYERSGYYDHPVPPPPITRTPDLDPGYSQYAPPPRPLKEPYADTYQRRAPDYGERPVPPPKHTPEDLTPPEEPASKRVAFRPAAYLENGEPIRYVFLPDQLRSSFLRIAAPNTNKGLETCGILCGTPVNNALFITCLLIPEQKSTPDTCETVNESAMLDYCIAEDLLFIGWIHTHPTQSCFMSSRDLHTQAGYQVMMPESIAIVCAPRHEPSYGIFRLTNPPGLPYILNCNQTETFHQHHIDNIYTGAMRPAGHVCEVAKLSFKVHDLRP
ncbi:hypothetical protein jhhlp_008304 [Lomentospora prolificans]|uniref:MPN domain-containing protein n=1 Tax=Lomentospora prolificans TaxID=41688 RepID=A0A2N3MXN4_9PEZI|nr:hypothetical protein jhhlp_008304 [Lomentospora prolificans]